MNKQHLSYPALEVLCLFMDGYEYCGSQIKAQVTMSVGSLYPLLRRLENAGWVKSRLEQASFDTIMRPKRKYYILTKEGKEAVLALLEPLHNVYEEFLIHGLQ